MEISVYDKLVTNQFREIDFSGTIMEYWKVYPYRHDDILFEAARNNETLRRRLLDGTPIVAALEHQLGDETQLSNPSPSLESDLRELVGYKNKNAQKLWTTANVTSRVVLTTITHSPLDAIGIGVAVLNVGMSAIKRDKVYKELRRRAEFIDDMIKSSDID